MSLVWEPVTKFKMKDDNTISYFSTCVPEPVSLWGFFCRMRLICVCTLFVPFRHPFKHTFVCTFSLTAFIGAVNLGSSGPCLYSLHGLVSMVWGLGMFFIDISPTLHSVYTPHCAGLCHTAGMFWRVPLSAGLKAAGGWRRGAGCGL